MTAFDRAFALLKTGFVPYAHVPDVVETMQYDNQFYHADFTSFYPHYGNDEHSPDISHVTGVNRPSPVRARGVAEIVCERCNNNLSDKSTHEHLDQPPKRHLIHGLTPDEDYEDEVNKWENRHRCPDGVSPWDLFVEQGRSQEGRALEVAQSDQHWREMEGGDYE